MMWTPSVVRNLICSNPSVSSGLIHLINQAFPVTRLVQHALNPVWVLVQLFDADAPAAGLGLASDSWRRDSEELCSLWTQTEDVSSDIVQQESHSVSWNWWKTDRRLRHLWVLTSSAKASASLSDKTEPPSSSSSPCAVIDPYEEFSSCESDWNSEQLQENKNRNSWFCSSLTKQHRDHQ